MGKMSNEDKLSLVKTARELLDKMRYCHDDTLLNDIVYAVGENQFDILDEWIDRLEGVSV